MADNRRLRLGYRVRASHEVGMVPLVRFARYIAKWAVIISLPIPLLWMLFSIAHYLPWQLRAIVIWGGIWLPAVILSAAVDYARVHGGGLGFFGFKRKKKKKKKEDEEEEVYYYDQKSAWEASEQQVLGDL